MKQINNINELINYIVNTINSNWDKMTQARYVYIEVGKYVQRYTDFFYSLDTKMSDLNLSIQELKEIYADDKSVHNDDDWNKIICKSGSIILKSIYDKLGIDCKIIKTVKPRNIKSKDGMESFELDHYFVCINIDNKNYFLTLAPDLFNIQNGLETEHYGGYVPGYIEYEDGSRVRYYEGELIEPELITKEELMREDYLIGYLNSYYGSNPNSYLSDNVVLNYNNAGLELLSSEAEKNDFISETTNFYRSLVTFKSGERVISFKEDKDSLSSLSEDDWKNYLDILEGFVIKKLSELINIHIKIDVKLSEDYNAWIKNITLYLIEYLKKDYGNNSLFNLDDDFDFDNWFKQVKKNLRIKPNSSNNPLAFMGMVNSFIKIINSRNFNKREFNILLHNISKFYLPKNLIYDKKRYTSNEFIAKKLSILFGRVFDVNNGPTEFNKLGYMEQMDTIKKAILAMFKDLTLINVGEENYNGKYSLPFNRIMIYPLKNKDDGHYAIVFSVTSVYENGKDYYLLYNNKTNTLEFLDILDIKGKLNYEILSDRFRNILDDLEQGDMQKKHTI